jgi:hypothetical protein
MNHTPRCLRTAGGRVLLIAAEAFGCERRAIPAPCVSAAGAAPAGTAGAPGSPAASAYERAPRRGGAPGLCAAPLASGAAADAARRWLNGVRNRDLYAIAENVAYPFQVKDSGAGAHCPTPAVAVEYGPALYEAVACLLSDAWLQEALDGADCYALSLVEGVAGPETSSQAQAVPSAQASLVLSTEPLRGTLVRHTYTLTLSLSSRGVSSITKHGSIEVGD